MVLYHGTDETRLAGILADGLRTRNETGQANWGGAMSSFAEFVYLTPSLDWRYAIHAAGEAHAARTDPDARPPRPILVEVNVGTEHLYPDEDHLRTCIMFGTGCSKSQAEAAVDADAVRQSRERWQESLAVSGAVAHMGPIQTKQVRRVLVLDHELLPPLSDLLFAWPYISANGKYQGPRGECCRQVHRWLWGEIREVSSLPYRIANDDFVEANVSLPRLPDGTRRFLILRHGEVVEDRAA